MFTCGACSDGRGNEAPHFVTAGQDRDSVQSWQHAPCPEDGTSELLAWVDAVFVSEYEAMRARHELMYKTLSLHLATSSEKAEVPGRKEQLPSSHVHPTSMPEAQGAAEQLQEAPEAGQSGSKRRRTTMALGRSQQELSWDFWQEKPWYHPGRIVRSPMFEIFFSCLIVANTVAIAAESQYN